MDTTRIDWSRFDTEEVVRGLNKEEREKRLGEISMIIELQGKINKLKITLKTREKKKRKEKKKTIEDVGKVMREIRRKEKKRKREEE